MIADSARLEILLSITSGDAPGLSVVTVITGGVASAVTVTVREPGQAAILVAGTHGKTTTSSMLAVVLDQMTVPRNASAVIRTAEALGLQEMHFIHAHGYLVPQRAVTKRCERWLDLRQADDAAPVIEGLRERGYRILGALRWGQLGDGHVSARDPELTDHFWLLDWGNSAWFSSVSGKVTVAPSTFTPPPWIRRRPSLLLEQIPASASAA